MKPSLVLAAALAALLLAPACASAPRPRQAQFETPDEAARQLVAALRAGDVAQIEEILGSGNEDLVHSGDDVADRAGQKRFVEAYDAKHAIEENPEGGMTLVVGDHEWPFPIPIVRAGDAWRFDTAAGRDEILDRRIGRNELDTIQACLAFCDAQEDYALRDFDKNGFLEYADAFLSTPGKRDGLYWEAKEGEEPSPLGPLVAEAVKEGYGGARGSPRPYRGYYFRILKAQGPAAPGGARNYVERGCMLGGYALLAVPAEYGNSGVMSFMVSHDRVVYEADLGPDTTTKAAAIEAFDPVAPPWKPAPR